MREAISSSVWLKMVEIRLLDCIFREDGVGADTEITD